MTTPIKAEEFRSQIETGDLKGAAKLLLERHGADCLAVCRGMVGDDDAAQDLFHDSFMLACNGLAGYRGEAMPKTWLLKITHNRCIDHLRREKRRPWVLARDVGWKSGGDDGEDDWIEEGYSPEERSAVDDFILDGIGLERAMGALDERDRSLIVLRYAHQMSFAELGEAFGVKPGAMRMRVQRVLERLREAMGVRVAESTTAVTDSAPMMPQRRGGRRRRGRKIPYSGSEEYLSTSPPDSLVLFVDQMRQFRVPLEKTAILKLLVSVDGLRL
jgi:RNA polymerase sigma-70 factor (ECF subfamily)